MGPRGLRLGGRNPLLLCGLLLVFFVSTTTQSSHGDDPPEGMQGQSVTATVGVNANAGPVDACHMFAGLGIYKKDCKQQGSPKDFGLYKLYTISISLNAQDKTYPDVHSLKTAFHSATPSNYYQGTLEFFDINECAKNLHECSANARCENEWATYKCTCKEGYEDKPEPGKRPGYRCVKPQPPTSPIDDIEVWVWVLIGVAVLVVVLLIFCCCCFFTTDSCCHPVKTVRHVKVLPKSDPPCSYKPPEEKKIVIQVNPPPPPPEENKYGPIPKCHSAFVANSGLDGNVYMPSEFVGQGAPLTAQPLTIAAPPLVSCPAPVMVAAQPMVTAAEPVMVSAEPVMMGAEPVADTITFVTADEAPQQQMMFDTGDNDPEPMVMQQQFLVSQPMMMEPSYEYM